jgi:hypothetical protein
MCYTIYKAVLVSDIKPKYTKKNIYISGRLRIYSSLCPFITYKQKTSREENSLSFFQNNSLAFQKVLCQERCVQK